MTMAKIDLYQLDDFNDDFAPNRVDRSIPMWDGQNNQFTPKYFGKAPHFGEEFQYFQTTDDVSTNGKEPQTYFSWNTSVLPVGMYVVFTQICWRTSNVSSLLILDLLKNDVSLFDHPQVESVSSNNNSVRSYVNGEGLFEVTTPAVVNFKVKHAREGSSGTVYLYNGYIRVFRIS